MALTTYHERMQRIDQLIHRKATGTPQQLANKLGLKKRMVFEYLSTMKDMGLSIRYCKVSRSYRYTDDKRLEL